GAPRAIGDHRAPVSSPTLKAHPKKPIKSLPIDGSNLDRSLLKWPKFKPSMTGFSSRAMSRGGLTTHGAPGQ
ncbi:unnamed protein product, partial [Staurois parvus]